MGMDEGLRELLLEAPDTQLDASMKPLIEKWSKPAKAREILEVVDQCIFSALASGVILIALEALYEEACKAENTIHEDVIKDAPWRDEH
jgi:hypothetical protein